jgi:hypothetical protein
VLADRSVTWLGSERQKRRYFPDKLPIGYEREQYRWHVR